MRSSTGAVVFSGPLSGLTATAGLAKIGEGTVVISGSAGYRRHVRRRNRRLCSSLGAIGNTAVTVAGGDAGRERFALGGGVTNGARAGRRVNDCGRGNQRDRRYDYAGDAGHWPER